MSELKEFAKWQPSWKIEKYINEKAFLESNPYEVVDIKGNLLLNAGITVLLNLLSGSGTAYSNANARLGVGDSTTAAAASQTGLQAATNKTYKAQNATYPQVSAQTITFKSDFGTTDANYSWQEFIVDNGTTTLNRLVSNQGTKVNGQVWTLTLTITIS